MRVPDFAFQKFMVALAVVVVFIVALAACGTDSPDARPVSSSGLSEKVFVLSDGREITCITWSGGYGGGHAGGLSCDW